MCPKCGSEAFYAVGKIGSKKQKCAKCGTWVLPVESPIGEWARHGLPRGHLDK